MSFEEEFPNLKGRDLNVDNWEECFSKTDIKEYCLDKKRVTQVIKSIDCWCDQMSKKEKCQRCKAIERLGL